MSTVDRPDPEQLLVFARMSPESKLALVRRIRDEAVALKAAWLRELHPDDPTGRCHGAATRAGAAESSRRRLIRRRGLEEAW